MIRRPPRSTLSLHDALPICNHSERIGLVLGQYEKEQGTDRTIFQETGRIAFCSRRCSRTERSEEHTSELQSHVNLVCRLLLEKKKNRHPDHSINNTCV